jgi:FtsZ-binding cell division protein ZapB
MGCGTSTPVHPEGGAETDAMQALAQQIAALRSENDALQQQLTSTRSESVALQQRLTSTCSESVALQEQLTSTRSQLAGALTREQVVTGRLAFFVKMDKDEKDLAERIAKLKLELAELQTSASSASQLSTSAQAHPAASPAQALGDTPLDAAVFEVDPTKSAHAALDFRMRLGLRIAAGPEDFFALADTKDDKLSPQGWLEACKSSLGNVDEGNVDEALCRSLFDEMVI